MTVPVPRWIAFACAAILAAQILDAATYAAFFMHPLAGQFGVEQNPVIRALSGLGGVTLVVAVKLGYGYWAWRTAPKIALMRGRTRATMPVILPLIVGLTLMGAAFNTHASLRVYGW